MRRMIAVAAVCTAGLALTACKAPGSQAGSAGTPSPGQSSAGPSPSSSAAETRRITARLATAVHKLTRTSFQFDGGSGIARVDGSFDPVGKRGDISGSFGIGAAQVLVIGSDLYVKGVAEDPKLWVHIDTGRLAPGNVLTQATDPTVSTGYLDAIESASQEGPRQYQGSIDVAKLTEDAAGSDRNAAALLKLLGDHPSRATFEASVDTSGRLTRMTVTVPDPGSSASTTVTTRYHDFGTPVDASRPAAGEVREAPQQLYTVLAPTPGVSGSPSPTK
ncbi:MAG: hypothetical protein WCA46_11510 [Actinocatenispora sp.]